MAKITKLDVIDEVEEDISIVTVQKANNERGQKITIPKTKVPYIKTVVGSRVKVLKAKADGEPALLLVKIKL